MYLFEMRGFSVTPVSRFMNRELVRPESSGIEKIQNPIGEGFRKHNVWGKRTRPRTDGGLGPRLPPVHRGAVMGMDSAPEGEIGYIPSRQPEHLSREPGYARLQ